jgi:prepilin-type processing-associated H-X9-DG protein
MYGDDFDDYFPYEGTPDPIDHPNNLNAWYNSTASYMSQPTLLSLYQQNTPPLIGQKSIFVCPSATNKAANPTPASPVFYYGFNNHMDPNGPAQFKRSECRFYTETVTFTEGQEEFHPSTSGRYTPARHSQRANLGFADGHAATVEERDFRRLPTEDTVAAEFSRPRKVYWWPYPNAP